MMRPIKHDIASNAVDGLNSGMGCLGEIKMGKILESFLKL